MRQYLIGSWANADSYDYSGEMLMGNRHGVSRRVHWNPDGSAAVQSYGDDEPKAKKPSLKQRILPQASRVEKLRSEAIELEVAFKAGEFSAEEYTLLREVAFKKLRRAEELLKKAITPVQKEEESYEDEAVSYTETFSTTSDNNGHGGSYSSPVGGSFFAEVIDELSETNSLKSFLKMSCKVVRKAVQLSQAARNYYLTLKAL